MTLIDLLDQKIDSKEVMKAKTKIQAHPLYQNLLDDTEKWFEENIQIQFEIDSGLNINILLCHGEPYYLIGDTKNDNRINKRINWHIQKTH